MQRYQSKKTCIKQLPAVFKQGLRMGLWKKGNRNLDIGGGKYEITTEWLGKKGVANYVYDPYNRDWYHNFLVDCEMGRQQADTVTISNVLNVIKEPKERMTVLRAALVGLKLGGSVLITVWPGRGDSRGRTSHKSESWQNHRPLRSYLPEVGKMFPNAKVQARMIIATKDHRIGGDC